jgi:hypothetical protein
LSEKKKPRDRTPAQALAEALKLREKQEKP